jgi:hypothetical protein
MVLRWHPLFRLTERDLDRADEWFDRKGGRIVLFGRMVRSCAAPSRSPPARPRCPCACSPR